MRYRRSGPPWRFSSSTSRRYVPSSLNLFVSVPSFAPEISASPSCLPSALKRRMNKSHGEPRLRVLPEKTRRWSLAAGNSNQSRSFGLAKRPLTTEGTRTFVAVSGVSSGSTSSNSGNWLAVRVTKPEPWLPRNFTFNGTRVAFSGTRRLTGRTPSMLRPTKISLVSAPCRAPRGNGALASGKLPTRKR